MLSFFNVQPASLHSQTIAVIYSFALASFLSSLIAYSYIKTFAGLSFSRNFVQSLMLGSITATMVMMAIGDSLARGLGMMGALAIIRFRTNFKDPRDIIYMFVSLGVGIASGVGAFHIAISGALTFVAVSFILHKANFSSTYYDGLLRFSIENNDPSKDALERILTENCRAFALISVREMQQQRRLDYAYHVKMKKGVDRTVLISKLRKNINSVEGISILMQDGGPEV